MSRLAISQLTKVYVGSAAVKNVDLEVADGEFVSILGPSGCGKTTTLRCVAGLETPTSGGIAFGERDVTKLPTEKRNIGMVFQNYALFPHMTVAENIGFGLEMRGVQSANARKRIDTVMDMVQLSGFGDRIPRQLSGGQQQRVALARALVVEPAILLLDEPLANLDAKLRDEMRFFIRSLQQRVGITTLYVTHDQAESMTMSDRIVVMFDGAIHQIGAPRDIYDRPRTREVARFIGQSNFLRGTLVARERNRVSVETVFGRIQSEAPPDLGDLSEVDVMIRPEAISLAPESQGVSGRVLEEHFLGNLVDYKVSLPDGTVINVQAMGGKAYGPGAKVGVVIDDMKVWLLP